MSSISKFEDIISGWLKPLPHLPVKGQKWLSANVWWIILIATISSGIGLLVSIGGFFTLLALWGAVSTSYYGYYATQSVGGFWVVTSIISMLFMVAMVVVSAMAISPLKSMKKKGWTLLFLMLLISAVEIVVSAIVDFHIVSFIFSIIFGAISLAIGAYFIFEIRSYFAATSKK